MSEAIQCKGCEAVSYNEFGLTSLYCGYCYQAQAATLADVQKERDRLRDEFLVKYGDGLTLQQWEKQRMTMAQQLTDAQATIQRLEEELKPYRPGGDWYVCPPGKATIQQRLATVSTALATLIREATRVADDHHRSRYVRLDEALESAHQALAPAPGGHRKETRNDE